jgi:pantetheine-phosphate adenylyltransferase
MASIAVFPATFDPITNGHLAIAERAARVFDHLVIGVYNHAGKQEGGKRPLFSADERVALVSAVVRHLPKVTVRRFDGLAVEFAQSVGAHAIVRGLRVADDFEFERQMAMMNRHLAPEVETLLLISDPGHAFVSATIVREVALMGGDVSQLVPAPVAEALAEKARSLRPPG